MYSVNKTCELREDDCLGGFFFRSNRVENPLNLGRRKKERKKGKETKRKNKVSIQIRKLAN